MTDAPPPSIPPRPTGGSDGRRTVSSRSVPVDAPAAGPVGPVAADVVDGEPAPTERTSAEHWSTEPAPVGQSPVEQRERIEPEPAPGELEPEPVPAGADAPAVIGGPLADEGDAPEDEDDEPTPLAAAVATTTSWLRKAGAVASAKVTSTYASITRPAPEEDTMTSTERAEFATVGATEATSSWPTADAVRPIMTGARPVAGAAVPAPGSTGGARRVRLAVSRVDPWSVMKLSFLLSFALGIIGVVATAVVWFTLDGLHVFANINELVTTVAGTASSGQVLSYFSFGKVVAGAMLIGVVDVFLLTAIATIGAFLYNIVAALVGGLHVTMTDD